VRFVPCLYTPLTGIFILLLGQMFSDWLVMGAVLSLCVGQLALTLFASGFEKSTTDKTSAKPQASYLHGYHCSLFFNLAALVCVILALIKNPELQVELDGDMVAMGRFAIFFLIKFMISRYVLGVHVLEASL
jgi:hypothetical protein